MEQIRGRFQELLAIEKHSIRAAEHRTFSRLMYRNRNQHRHGFYFRKLEEVRRVLRRIQQHLAWKSIREAVTPKGIEKRQAAKNAPLALSSVTQDDIKSLETLYTRFVLETIPSAARQVTDELISRSHFLPFAVTMVSMLSRIYVLEKKILQELRGALLELGLLFSVQERRPTYNTGSRPVEGCMAEDVGTEVALLENDQIAPHSGQIQTAKKAVSLPHMSCSNQIPDKLHDPVKRGVSETETDMESIARTPNAEPSLYHIVSSRTSGSQFPVVHTGRARVSIPVSYKSGSETNQTDFQSNVIDELPSRSASPKRYTATQDRDNEVEGGKRNTNQSLASRGNMSETKQSHATVTQKCIPEEPGSSDSEDLDDIFGALDD